MLPFRPCLGSECPRLDSAHPLTPQYCRQLERLATKLELLVEPSSEREEVEIPDFYVPPCNLLWNTKKLVPKKYVDGVDGNFLPLKHINDPTLTVELIKGRMLLVPEHQLKDLFKTPLLCMNGRLLVLAGGLIRGRKKISAFTFDSAHKRATRLTRGQKVRTLDVVQKGVKTDWRRNYHSITTTGGLAHDQKVLKNLKKPNRDKHYEFKLLLYRDSGPILQAADINNIPIQPVLLISKHNIACLETVRGSARENEQHVHRKQNISLIRLVQLLKYFHAQHGLNVQLENKLLQELGELIDGYDKSSSGDGYPEEIISRANEFIMIYWASFDRASSFYFQAFLSQELQLANGFLLGDRRQEQQITVFDSTFNFDRQVFDASACNRIIPYHVCLRDTIPFSLNLRVKEDDGDGDRRVNIKLAAFIDNRSVLYLFQKDDGFVTVTVCGAHSETEALVLDLACEGDVPTLKLRGVGLALYFNGFSHHNHVKSARTAD